VTLVIEEGIGAQNGIQPSVFESFVETSTEGFAMATLEGEIQYLNPAMLQLLGFEDLESLSGKSFIQFVAEEHRTKYEQEVFPLLRKEGRWSGESLIISRTRGLVPVHEHLFVVPDNQGRPSHIAAVITDISQMKKVEQALRESEERYRSLYMGVPIALYRTDLKTGKVLECNQLGAELAGFESTEDAMVDFIPAKHYSNPDDRKIIHAMLLEHGEIRHYQTQMTNDDGKSIWIEFSARLYPEEGFVEFAVADITEKRAAEDRLRESEHLYRTILDTLPSAVTVTDQSLKIAIGNKKLAEIQGVDSVDDMVGLDGLEIIVPEDRERAIEQSMKAMTENEIQTQEFTLIRRDGTRFPSEITASVVRDAEGNPTHFIAVSNDITERIAVEELQRIQHKLMTSLSTTLSFKDSVDLILEAALRAEFTDSGGIYIVNEMTGALDLVNHSGLSDEFIQRISYLDENTLQAQMVKLGQPVYGNYEEIPGVDEEQLKEGLKAISIIPIKHEGKVTAVLNIASHTHDEFPEQTRNFLETMSFQVGAVLERAKAEEKLRESEEKFSLFAEHFPGALFIKDTESRHVYVNRYVEDVFFDTEFVGRPSSEVFLSDDIVQRHFEEDKKVLEGNVVEAIEHLPDGKGIEHIYRTVKFPIIKKDGSRLIGGLSIDITEMKKAEMALQEAQEKLLRTERMAVLGRVSGGIGHELRNPLAAMKNATYYLKMVLDTSDEDVQETLDILDSELATSEMIITSLLDYARPKAPTRKKAELKDLVQSAMSRVSHLENIEVVQDFSSDIPTLLVDPVQITRVIINLARNAAQAMPDGGTLTIKGSMPEPDWISLSIIDTGIGMSEETMSHLFEPLYTTKAKGIGLGLVIIKSLVEVHGGIVDVESEEGKGSTFTVRLPVAKKEVI
jgi:PAS domain S-box-containing protein